MTSFSGGGRVMRNRIGETPTVGRQVLPNAPGLVAPRTVSSDVLTQLDQFLGAINSVDRLANSAASYANTVDSINRRTAAEARAAQDQIRRDAERSQKELEAAQTFDRGIAKESADLNAPHLTDMVSNGKIGRLPGETDQQFVARVTDPFVPQQASASYRQKFVDELGPKIMAAEVGFQKEAKARAESDILVAGSNAVYASQTPEEIQSAIKAVEQSTGPMSVTKQADLIVKPALERAAARGDEKAFNVLSTAYLQRNGDATKVEAEAAKLRATQQNLKAQESSRVRDMLDRELARLPLDLAEVQFNANRDKLTGSDELIVRGRIDTMRREAQQQQRQSYEQAAKSLVSAEVAARIANPFGDAAKGIGPASVSQLPRTQEIQIPGGTIKIDTHELVQQELDKQFGAIDAMPVSDDVKAMKKANIVAANGVKYDGWSRTFAAAPSSLSLDQNTGQASPAFVEAAKLYGQLSPYYGNILDEYVSDNNAKRALAVTAAAAEYFAKPGSPPDYTTASRDVLSAMPRWREFSTFKVKSSGYFSGAGKPDEVLHTRVARAIANGKKIKNTVEVDTQVRTIAELLGAVGKLDDEAALNKAVEFASKNWVNVNGWAVPASSLPKTQTVDGEATLSTRDAEALLERAVQRYYESNKKELESFGVSDPGQLTYKPGPKDNTWIPAFGTDGRVAPNATGWIVTRDTLLDALGPNVQSSSSINAALDRLFGTDRQRKFVADTSGAALADQIKSAESGVTVRPDGRRY